jgi:Fur family peroxide stress response transcriptional regulator
MNTTSSRFEQMCKKLKVVGYKLTPQRMVILKILSERTDHPNPESIYAALKMKLPTTSPATVYKTLAVLKKLNEVLEIQYSNESNRYDGVNPKPHPHIYCTQCKKFSDLDLLPYDGLFIEIEQQTGYQIHTMNLSIEGICPNCQSRLDAIAVSEKEDNNYAFT